MIVRILVATSVLLALTACGYEPTPARDPSNGPPASSLAPAPAGAVPSGEEPMPVKTVSVSIRVECHDSVNVFYGNNPRFGSGTASRLGPNSIQNHTGQPGDTIWLTDEQRNPMDSAKISETTHEVTVACHGISAK